MTTGLAFPKPKPAKVERAERKAARERKDKAESAKVRERSGGRCEVWEDERGLRVRCFRRAIHVHHLLSGIGVRGRRASALATNKVHVCAKCHADIHAHVLVPDGECFRRAR